MFMYVHGWLNREQYLPIIGNGIFVYRLTDMRLGDLFQSYFAKMCLDHSIPNIGTIIKYCSFESNKTLNIFAQFSPIFLVPNLTLLESINGYSYHHPNLS